MFGFNLLSNKIQMKFINYPFKKIIIGYLSTFLITNLLS